MMGRRGPGNVVGSSTIGCVPYYQYLAKSAQLIGQAITSNPSFLALRQIQATREMAQTITNSAILLGFSLVAMASTVNYLAELSIGCDNWAVSAPKLQKNLGILTLDEVGSHFLW